MSNANVSIILVLVGTMVSVLGCDGAADRLPDPGAQRITQRPAPPTTQPGDNAAGQAPVVPMTRPGTDVDEVFGEPAVRGGRFFGVMAGQRAAKIVYVVDRSGSMAVTFPYVKAELNRSINTLTADQQFTVIFFADDRPSELAIEGRTGLHLTGLHEATEPNKQASAAWVNDQIAQSLTGKTDPRQALERAFRVRGRPPELIYFLTDGLFPPGTLDLLRKLNPDKKVRINTIMFADRNADAEKLLQQIAREHGGVYRFISEEQLGSDY